VRFSVEHRFPVPVERVEQAMTDPAFFTELRDLPGVEPPAVLERTHDHDRVRLRVRYVFSGHLPPIARRVLGHDELAWVQESTVDLTRHRTDFRVRPERHRERLGCHGTYLLRADGGDTVRTIAGDLVVHVPLLAGRAERAIASGLVERLDAEAVTLRRWLATR
jgi:hypothetical protein